MPGWLSSARRDEGVSECMSAWLGLGLGLGLGLELGLGRGLGLANSLTLTLNLALTLAHIALPHGTRRAERSDAHARGLSKG